MKILTLNKISEQGLKLLGAKYEYSDNQQNPDGILLRSASMHDMDFPKSLLAVARAGAGVNNIPIDKCSQNGIVVFNTPGANANAVKELAVAALLLSSRRIVDGISWVKTLTGDNVEKDVEKGKSKFAGPEIEGKTIGIIGLGAIGVMVANAAMSLGMNVIGYDPYISVEAAWGLSRAVKRAVDIKELFAVADYISLHVPLNNETKGMINASSLDTMKNDLRIINFSRGELVNNDDIKEAVKTGKVACYVTDFPQADIINVDGIIAIPHLGASTPESEDNCAHMAVAQIKEYLEFGNITNSVNLPNVFMQKTEDAVRIAIIHKNIPNMLGQISTELAKIGLNIENMLNKSKKDMAYTLVDVSGEIPSGIEEALYSINEVLRVRIIV